MSDYSSKQWQHPDAHPLTAPSVGLNCQRSCTDCPFLLVFLLAWAGAAYVAYLGFLNGDPARLLAGTDYMGNTCGVGDFANRSLVWYPVSFNTKTASIDVSQALQLGLCVSTCPQLGDQVSVYGNLTGTNLPDWWLVLFDSTPEVNRCFPDVNSFDCNTTSVASSSSCLEALAASANSTFPSIFSSFQSTLDNGFNALKTEWWVVLAGIAIVVVLSFIWLFLLRYIVKPVVVLTSFLVLAAIIGLGVLLWWIKGVKDSLTPPETQEAQYFMYGAIAAWAVAFIFFCVMLFLRKDVMIACDIIEDATEIPGDIPSMLLVPPISFIGCLPFLGFFVVVAIYVQSCGNTIDLTVPAPSVISSTAAVFTRMNVSSLVNVSDIVTQQYQAANWRTYAQLYNLFILLWSVGLVGAISFMIIAMCGVFWYWSVPGDDKKAPPAAVCIAFKDVIRYHLGTVAIGSLLVALIQMMRVILAFVEHHMQKLKQNTKAGKYVFACLECYLAYLERVVKFINKNAYIMCAMQSTNFIESARDAIELLVANAISVAALSIISEYVIIFGKILVTVSGVLITWVILNYKNGGDLQGAWVILLIVLVAGYLVCCLFANVFSVCIDTVLLCYCYDKKQDGRHYFPSNLDTHIAVHAAKRGQRRGDGTGLDEQLQATRGDRTSKSDPRDADCL